MTTRPESAPTPPRTRRALLAGALGGLGAWVAAAAVRVDPTAAAAGDPIRMGALNKAGGTSTTLQTSSSGAALRVIQLHGSSAVRAEGTSGRAVQALAGSGGTGVWAHSPDHIGVRGTSDSGIGLYAASSSGKGIYATSSTDTAIFAQSGSNGQGYAASLIGHVLVFRSLEMSHTGTPDAPIGNRARLFVRHNGAVGKDELCVRFQAGDVIVLATQP